MSGAPAGAVRVVACAIVAAIVWYLLTWIAFAMIGGSFLEGVLRAGLEPASPTRFVAMNLGPAVWAVLLYWGLEEQHGATPLNIVKAGGGWWLIHTLVHAKSFGFGIIRLPDDYGIATLLTMLAVSLVAMFAGAKLFDRLDAEEGDPYKG